MSLSQEVGESFLHLQWNLGVQQSTIDMTNPKVSRRQITHFTFPEYIKGRMSMARITPSSRSSTSLCTARLVSAGLFSSVIKMSWLL